MRLVGLSVWLFLNLVVLGMCSYLYLLWVQYWRYAQAAKLQSLQEQGQSHCCPSDEFLRNKLEIIHTNCIVMSKEILN